MLRKNEAFKGHETWWTAVQMQFKMYFHTALLILILHILTTLILSYLFYHEAWSVILKFTWTAFWAGEFSYIANSVIPFVLKLLRKSAGIFIISSAVWLLYPTLIALFKKRAKEQSKDVHIRGAKLIEPKELMREIRKAGEKTDIPLGSVTMPVSAEPKHVFVIGRPGVGKTVALSAVINRLRERDAKAVVYDFKGDYLSKFYDPDKDIIFNPLDVRCQGWSLFNEIETYMDIDSISTSLIPPAVSNTDPFWNDAARDVFAGILHYLYQSNARTNMDIWSAVTSDGKSISAWLKNTKGGERGYRYIEDASSKQAMSVFSVMMQYVKSFEYMSKADGPFSIKEWLSDDNKGGFIFITSYADIQDTLRPILSLFVDLLGRKLLSMKDDYHRRIFFVIDEFGTLQRLSTITKLLTLSRSKGGSVWIGIQDVGQLDKIYTSHIRQTIINACGTSLIFNVADPETAHYLSSKLGEREYSEVEETFGMGVEDNRDGISLIRRKRTEKLILPSEIQNLPDLTAYLKLPGYDIAKIKLQYKHYEDKTEPFVCRDDLNLANIVAEQEQMQESQFSFSGDGKYHRNEQEKNAVYDIDDSLEEIEREA